MKAPPPPRKSYMQRVGMNLVTSRIMGEQLPRYLDVEYYEKKDRPVYDVVETSRK